MKINPERIDEENPEWTVEDFNNAVPFSALPQTLQTTLRTLPTQKNTQISTTIRLDREVIDAFRANGKDWQNSINEILKDWLKTHAVIR